MIRIYYIKSLLVSIGIFAILSIICLFGAELIIQIIYGEEYLPATQVMRILTIAAFLNGTIRYTSANALSYMGKPKYNIIIGGIGILLQLGLSLYVIPKHGIVGAAWISVLIYLVMGTYLMIVFWLKYLRPRKS